MEQSQVAPSLAAPAPARVSAAGRLVNVIIDPFAAFRGVDLNPTWLLAFVALVTLRFGSLFAFYRPDVTPSKLVAGVIFQVMTVAPAVTALAFVLWLVAKLWRTNLSWGSALSVTVHVMFAYTLSTVAIASIAGALLPDAVAVDLRSPPFTNLAPLAGADASGVVRALLAALDIRMAYSLGLVYLGAAAVVPAEERYRARRVVATCVGLHIAAAVGPALARG